MRSDTLFRILGIICVLFWLEGCYALNEAGVDVMPTRSDIGHPVAIMPVKSGPSNPSVITSRGVLAYNHDLQACKAKAGSLGSGSDDVAALERAVNQRPLQGSVSVSYRSDDVAMNRDKIVRECLSQRGYLVQR